MARYVALLRGVNVGRANRVPMAEFRDLLGQSGCTGARTLLNSGNAVFASRARSPSGLADRIRAALAQRLAVEVPVIVKPEKVLAAVVAGNGIARLATDPSRLLVAFTQDAKALADLEAVSRLVRAPERFLVGDHAAYLWCPGGLLESKAAVALLGRVGQATTTRNWATVLKIRDLLEEVAD